MLGLGKNKCKKCGEEIKKSEDGVFNTQGNWNNDISQRATGANPCTMTAQINSAQAWQSAKKIDYCAKCSELICK